MHLHTPPPPDNKTNLSIPRLLYRAFLVLTKPVEELINLLGLEVPVPPSLSLAGIKADGFVLHWKGSEQKGIAIRHQLMVNGQNSMYTSYAR